MSKSIVLRTWTGANVSDEEVDEDTIIRFYTGPGLHEYVDVQFDRTHRGGISLRSGATLIVKPEAANSVNILPQDSFE